MNDVEATPSVVADAYGDISVVEHYANPAQYETLVRSLAVAGGGSAFVIDSPISAARAFGAGIKGTVSRAINLGGIVRESLARGDNPVSAVVHFLSAFTLFQGEVSEFALNEQAGFLVGEIWIDGRKEWSSRRLRVSVKNENMIAWLNDKQVAMIPDSICLVDESGYGVTNSAIKKKLKVSVLGVISPPIWRTQKGLDHFGPRRLGFQFDYIPVEELQAHR